MIHLFLMSYSQFCLRKKKGKLHEGTRVISGSPRCRQRQAAAGQPAASCTVPTCQKSSEEEEGTNKAPAFFSEEPPRKSPFSAPCPRSDGERKPRRIGCPYEMNEYSAAAPASAAAAACCQIYREVTVAFHRPHLRRGLTLTCGEDRCSTLVVVL